MLDFRPRRLSAPAARGQGDRRAPAAARLSERILALERAAGNAAVSALLRPRARTIARFVGTEHRDLGNATGASIDLGNGVVLTWGEVVAVAGDEYKSVEDLMEDTRTPDGRARLRAALEHAGVPGAIAGTLPAPSPTQRSEHEIKFIRLAMTNVEHFPDGGQAVNAWANHHAAAIEIAVRAGLANNPGGIALAYVEEAFGEHFLTDCFSGGHIRTPRRAIVDFYTRTFAPRVAGPLLANIRTRLIEALVREASPQTAVPDDWLRFEIAGRVNPGIEAAVAAAGGMAALTEFIGLGVAGAISGAIHDQEGKVGVMVASDAHPEPWRAYGDHDLGKSPVSREQATAAIAEAKAQVDEAYRLGEAQAVDRDTAVAENPPIRLHFAFASSALAGDAAASVAAAAAYMTYRPDSVVRIIGHTDPIGSDSANLALGQARAEAVRAALTGRGVDPGRVAVESMGELALVTRDPRQYQLNRRADFAWATGASAGGGGAPPSDQDRAMQLAMAAAQAQADTARVTRFVPRPVEERAQASVPGGNAELPEWHWGRLDATFRASVDTWIRGAVGARLEAALDTVPQLDPQTSTVPVTGTTITVHPRDRAKEIVRALIANPTAQLGALMGEAPGP